LFPFVFFLLTTQTGAFLQMRGSILRLRLILSNKLKPPYDFYQEDRGSDPQGLPSTALLSRVYRYIDRYALGNKRTLEDWIKFARFRWSLAEPEDPRPNLLVLGRLGGADKEQPDGMWWCNNPPEEAK
jgi:hypothetical protein